MMSHARARLRVAAVCLGLLFTTTIAGAQDGRAQRDLALPDNPSQSSDSYHENDSPTQREVTWRSLPGDFLHDQKAIWLFPGVLAALIATLFSTAVNRRSRAAAFRRATRQGYFR